MFRRDFNKYLCATPLISLSETSFKPSIDEDIYHLQYLFLTYIMPYGKNIYRSASINFDLWKQTKSSYNPFCELKTNTPFINIPNYKYNMCHAYFRAINHDLDYYIHIYNKMTKKEWYCPRQNKILPSEIEIHWCRHYPGTILSEYKHIKEFQQRENTINKIEQYYNLSYKPFDRTKILWKQK